MSGDECPGKFDVLDEDIGSGEFGRVLKVRRKADDDDDFGSMNAKDNNVYAIKKSKPIEGAKHRYVFYRGCGTWLRTPLLSDCACERKSIS